MYSNLVTCWTGFDFSISIDDLLFRLFHLSCLVPGQRPYGLEKSEKQSGINEQIDTQISKNSTASRKGYGILKTRQRVRFSTGFKKRKQMPKTKREADRERERERKREREKERKRERERKRETWRTAKNPQQTILNNNGDWWIYWNCVPLCDYIEAGRVEVDSNVTSVRYATSINVADVADVDLTPFPGRNKQIWLQ